MIRIKVNAGIPHSFFGDIILKTFWLGNRVTRPVLISLHFSVKSPPKICHVWWQQINSQGKKEENQKQTSNMRLPNPRYIYQKAVHWSPNNGKTSTLSACLCLGVGMQWAGAGQVSEGPSPPSNAWPDLAPKKKKPQNEPWPRTDHSHRSVFRINEITL